MKTGTISQKFKSDNKEYSSYSLNSIAINDIINVYHSYSSVLFKSNGINYINLERKINTFKNLQLNWFDVYLYISDFLSFNSEIDVFPLKDGGIQFEIYNEYFCTVLELNNDGILTKYQKLQNNHLPNSQNIVVNGLINHNQQDKYEIIIQTNTGKINGKLSDTKLLQAVKNFHNKEATVYGKGHFNPNGTLNFIEIERILESMPEDKYFSKIPNAETAAQQIERQIAEKPYVNWMEKIAGLWPGNETDEEFEQLLKDMK